MHTSIMASTSIAERPTATVLGPVVTNGGLKGWYLVCNDDCIIAVAHSFLTTMTLSLRATNAGALGGRAGGAVGAAVGTLLERAGSSKHDKLVAELQNSPATLLKQHKANYTFPVAQLRSITLQPKKRIGHPEVIIQKNTGYTEFYQVETDFDSICEELKRLYPNFIKEPWSRTDSEPR